MGTTQIVGVVLIVVGVILVFFGFQGADRPLDQLAETFTGRYTDETMWYFVGGAAAAVGGVLLLLFGRRSRA